jgi:hypothetical protein
VQRHKLKANVEAPFSPFELLLVLRGIDSAAHHEATVSLTVWHAITLHSMSIYVHTFIFPDSRSSAFLSTADDMAGARTRYRSLLDTRRYLP